VLATGYQFAVPTCTQPFRGDLYRVMLMLTALAMPFVLMLLMLAMERVEEPLRVDQVGHTVRGLLHPDDDAEVPADQVERLVQEGYGPALERYWRRRRVLALLRREG
jgi:hypothetical protein